MEDNYTRLTAELAASEIQQHEFQQHHTPEDESANGKRKAEDGTPGQQRAKRNRYISIACNECKRRKIKCNGQAPCQRCGNLNLECVYAPNCCSGFKDSHEYKEMTGHIASLQDQVNALWNDLSNLRAQLGHPPPLPPPMQQQQHMVQQPPHLSPPQQQQHHTPIDPSLQSAPFPSHRPSYSMPQASPGAPVAHMTPNMSRPKSQSQSLQPSFRGPTSDEFNFGVAKSSLQTMGITGHEGTEDGSGLAGLGTADPSPAHSPPARNRAQFLQSYHADKDPIWGISQEETMRLCSVYEDEMGLMYPVLDMYKVTAYATKLYRFMEAAHRTGLMQQGMPGSDSIDDEDTNILKMVLATALTVEGSGRSELGRKLFEYVQPAVDVLLLGSVGLKGIRLLTMTATYEFQRDNEGTAWRIIGLTARVCIEMGLHRRETYEAMQDESERSETILLFWSIYVLDRRWSLGTGMPFALQDADIDPQLPKPEERSPYLMAMIQYAAIGSKVWRITAATPSSAGASQIDTEEMNYLDYQVIQWHRQIPVHLRFEHPSQAGHLSTPIEPPQSRAGHRLRILLYLRANQMRILIYRPILHSATSIMQHREHAQTVIDVAKDTIRVLTHINQTTDLYRTHQVLFNAFITSALAVLFLAVSHTPAMFAENVKDEFSMALDLVRGFSKGSWMGKRLWKTIRVLKDVGPKLGLAIKDSSNTSTITPQQPQQQDQPKDEIDPSRSAAVAMAGLAGHNVDEMALFNGNTQQWSGASGSSVSPEGMVHDLTSLFEAAGNLHMMGQAGDAANGGPSADGLYSAPSAGAEGMGQFSDEGLANILKELF
ncbi:hypothetical protein LTR36_005376 [Oleoguttula mirabilis]|uniref:Zn(2)-C6 fungal-type domain-containing protein n=1 Tax=Oleoguttula mirabilis TaxID=1507867 RepID=A0AAV9JFA7_9PEZI|nr:hypothetical protein LTR36_005376 [Oleoguttula mirabilis]